MEEPLAPKEGLAQEDERAGQVPFGTFFTWKKRKK